MAIRRKRETRDQRRYTRSSTKKGFVLRRPAHLGLIIAVILVALAIVALALLWGNYLKTQSDAHREAQELNEWTLDLETAVPHPVEVPDIRASAIYPEGNVGDIIIAGDHDGVIMTITGEDGRLAYQTDLATTLGLPVAPDAITLAKDVARVQKRGLRVTAVFTVTCLTLEDPVSRTYQRGLELALLREYAATGVDDFLLFGLPTGSDAKDAASVAFLEDLRVLLSDLPEPPAIGVALTLRDIATDSQDETAPLYAGNRTPARMLNACDYLALDLRSLPTETLVETLPYLQYAYVRYALRLLVDQTLPDSVEECLSHGFERVFEMPPLPTAEPEEET